MKCIDTRTDALSNPRRTPVSAANSAEPAVVAAQRLAKRRLRACGTLPTTDSRALKGPDDEGMGVPTAARQLRARTDDRLHLRRRTRPAHPARSRGLEPAHLGWSRESEGH